MNPMTDRLTMLVERRRALRHRVALPIRHRPIREGEADDFLLEYGRDLSSTGIFLETPSPFAVGTKLELVFRLPPDLSSEQGIHHIKVMGEVMWISAEESETSCPGMGIHFIDLGEDSLKLLEKIVRKVAVLPEDAAQH